MPKQTIIITVETEGEGADMILDDAVNSLLDHCTYVHNTFADCEITADLTVDPLPQADIDALCNLDGATLISRLTNALERVRRDTIDVQGAYANYALEITDPEHPYHDAVKAMNRALGHKEEDFT